MANREALRELQARLAARLQTAQSEGAAVAWLAVVVAGQKLLFPLGQSGEIHSCAGLQPVPYTRSWFIGVLNVRGSLYGVIDFGSFLAADQGHAHPPARTPAAESSVVTLNPLLEVNCALRVDSLAGLRGADAFKSSAPAPFGAPAFFGNQFFDSGGVGWQEIDLRSLAHAPGFLHISA